jgi:predicted RNA-binding Zn ribbon-like protein
MDFGHYADAAVDLINADLTSCEDIEAFLETRPWVRDQVQPGDLRALKRLQGELAAVVDASASGDETAVVMLLNALLEQHPVRPRISGHDTQDWHLHVNDTNASVATILAAEGLFGMALVVTEIGADRFGRCSAAACGNAYLDSSANHSKRFCCGRCASRTNVAAYRSRKSSDSEAGSADSSDVVAQ